MTKMLMSYPVDVDDVEINLKETRDMRIRSFLRQIKNPYLMKIDGVLVEMEYRDDGYEVQDAIRATSRLVS